MGMIAIGVSTGVFITVTSGLVLLILCACVIWKQRAGERKVNSVRSPCSYITEQASFYAEGYLIEFEGIRTTSTIYIFHRQQIDAIANRPFSTSCVLIYHHCCCFSELRTSEVSNMDNEMVVVVVEGGGGGGGGGTLVPPNTFSMGNGQTSLAHNSCTQRANALRLEHDLSTSYSTF